MRGRLHTTGLVLSLLLSINAVRAQGTFQIIFDEAPQDTQVRDLNSYYAGMGIMFGNEFTFVRGGLSAGDPGNWDLEGTVGPRFVGINDGRLDIQFSPPIASFTIDASRSAGSKDVTVFSFITFHNGARTIYEANGTFGPINSWSTITIAGGVFDHVQLSASGIEGGFAYTGYYGIDNLRFTQVPEPTATVLLCAGLSLLILGQKNGGKVYGSR